MFSRFEILYSVLLLFLHVQFIALNLEIKRP